MMTNERRAFGRPIILTIVTTLCIFCSAAVGQTLTRKVRSGESSSILCQYTPQGITYRWTLNGEDVTSDLAGIYSESIHNNRIRINRMTQQLAGVYRCYFDGDTQLLNTVELFIVGIAEYSNCPDLSCSINHTYSPSDRQFILNATIIFINSGVECCNEDLTISVWTVKPNPGTTEGSSIISRDNSKIIFPPGINITVRTSNDLTSNIAMVNIINATTMFQIVHTIHTVIDGTNARQLTLTFNFNYTIIEMGRTKPLSVENGAITVNVGSTVYTVNGLTIIIICDVTAGEAPFTITWYHNEVQVKQSVGNVSTIEVKNATDDDVFTCKADNGMIFDQQSTTIRFANNAFCLHP